MKALVATKETQGRRKNDFCHCAEGEYVTFGFECDRETVDGKCGCRRSLVGFDSSKATTTFRVKTVDMTEEQLRSLMRDRLTREGWISESHTDAANDEFLAGQVHDTLLLWSAFAKSPDGAVVERRGGRFYQRLRQKASLLDLQSATIRARIATRNDRIGTRVRSGEIQVIEYFFCNGRETADIKEVSGWMGLDQAVDYLHEMADAAERGMN